jgi:hypothetical protein
VSERVFRCVLLVCWVKLSAIPCSDTAAGTHSRKPHRTCARSSSSKNETAQPIRRSMIENKPVSVPSFKLKKMSSLSPSSPHSAQNAHPRPDRACVRGANCRSREEQDSLGASIFGDERVSLPNFSKVSLSSPSPQTAPQTLPHESRQYPSARGQTAEEERRARHFRRSYFKDKPFLGLSSSKLIGSIQRLFTRQSLDFCVEPVLLLKRLNGNPAGARSWLQNSQSTTLPRLWPNPNPISAKSGCL